MFFLQQSNIRVFQVRECFVVVLGTKGESPVAEIPQVSQEFRVVPVLEVIPHEFGVPLFGPVVDELLPPDFARDLSLDGIGAENPHVVGLAELGVFLVELLGRAERVYQFPVLVGAYECAGEEHGVELDIVFAHKLLVLNRLVLPPVSPVISLVCSY